MINNKMYEDCVREEVYELSKKLFDILKSHNILVGVLALSECIITGANLPNVCASKEDENALLESSVVMGSNLYEACAMNSKSIQEILIAGATMCSMGVLDQFMTVEGTTIN